MVFADFKNNGVNKSDSLLGVNNREFKKEGIVDLLFEGISSLERGLRPLNKNVETPVGKIDILAVDMVGRIVIVEVGKNDIEDLLFKSIDHFDWAFTNMKDLEERYKVYNIDPTLAPRILILAPSYTETFLKRASYLNPTFIDIYEYQVKESLGAKKVYFRPFSFLNHKKLVVDLRTKSLDDHLNYLEDEDLKTTLKSLIIEIQSLKSDYTIDTSKGYIGFRNKGGKLGLSIYVLKNSFWVNLGKHRWNAVLVKSNYDIQSLKAQILNAVRKEI